jgi:hypothetical protein
MSDAFALPACSVSLSATITSGAQWHQQRPTWVYQAFGAGSITDHSERGAERHPVSLVTLGSIPLPDGRLVACDPYLADPDEKPFVRAVPAGVHPVSVAVATIDVDHTRVMAALISFGGLAEPPAPIVEWELGWTDPAATDPAATGPVGIGEFVGYAVEAGTGCFASPAAIGDLSIAMRSDDGMLEDPVSAAIDSTPFEAAVASPREGGPALAAFRAGWGDGTYPTWFGLSTDGSASVALTDFLLFADPWQPGDAPAETAPAPLLPATHGLQSRPVPSDRGREADGDYAGRITAEEAAAALHRATRRKPGFWAKLFGRS